MTQRTSRVGDLLRTGLNELVRRQVRDPRVGLANVTRVEVAKDLSHAEVFVSVLGSEEQRLAAVGALEHARGFLRRELAHRLSLRVTPELAFVLDRGAEHSERITAILDALRAEDGHDS